MNKARVKLIVAAVTIAIAVSLLAMAGMGEGWVYYFPVDQFVAEGEHNDQRVRLHGIVGEDEFQASSTLLGAEFYMLGETQRIRVSYTGIIPDLFHPGAEVVIEGRLDELGVFNADTLMTKCASKYGTDTGEVPHSNPRNELQDLESTG